MKKLAPIRDKTSGNFEVPTEKVTFVLKPTYRVQIGVGPTNFVMHAMNGLVDSREALSMVNDAYLIQECRRPIQQLRKQTLLTATKQPVFVVGVIQP